MSDPSEMVLPEVALISPCGWGNLGDAAIVDSVICATRRRLPDRALAAFTLNPVDTAWRHRVPSFTCAGFWLPHYSVGEQTFAAPTATEPQLTADGEPPPPRSTLRQMVGRVPGMRRLALGGRSIVGDLRYRKWISAHTKRLRWVVIAGGGQLDDFWGGAFGHPYVLWRWARWARALESRYLVLSVGTGTLKTPTARYFVRQALVAADYRSFRDEGSRVLLDDPRVSRDPVVPDLAYGLPMEELSSAPKRGDRSIVAMSPIAYCDPRVWPVVDAGKYRSYVERLAALGAQILEAGHDLLLYATDRPDMVSVEDLRDELARRVPGDSMARVHIPVIKTHQDLFAELCGVRAVVASRLHGVLLAHLLGLPVAALSYERKVTTLMDSMGHKDYCLPIDTFDPPAAWQSLSELLARRGDLSEGIGKSVASFRRQVDEQYDSVLFESEST